MTDSIMPNPNVRTPMGLDPSVAHHKTSTIHWTSGSMNLKREYDPWELRFSGISYRMPKGKTPNAFQRWFISLLTGVTWHRISARTTTPDSSPPQ